MIFSEVFLIKLFYVLKPLKKITIYLCILQYNNIIILHKKYYFIIIVFKIKIYNENKF